MDCISLSASILSYCSIQPWIIDLFLLALEPLFHLKHCFFFWVWVCVPSRPEALLCLLMALELAFHPGLKHCFVCWWRWSWLSIQAWSIAFSSVLWSPFYSGLKYWIAFSAGVGVSVPSRSEVLHCILCWRWSLCSIQVWSIALHSLLALESLFNPGLNHCIVLSAGVGVSIPYKLELLLFLLV